jgi:hypothetical protein
MVAVLGPNEALPYHIHTYIYLKGVTAKRTYTSVTGMDLFAVKRFHEMLIMK